MEELIGFSEQEIPDSHKAQDIIKEWIIEDGIKDKVIRELILDPKFTHAGVSCGCHVFYGEVCCLLIGQNVKEIGQTPVHPVRKFTVEECKDSHGKSDDLQPDIFNYGTSYIPLDQHSLGHGTFEDISRSLFKELKELKSNPTHYATLMPEHLED